MFRSFEQKFHFLTQLEKELLVITNKDNQAIFSQHFSNNSFKQPYKNIKIISLPNTLLSKER